ncbi:MAG: TIGR01620 family protein [Pseudomonadota bacterium]
MKPAVILLDEEIENAFEAQPIGTDDLPIQLATKRLSRRAHWAARLFWSGLLSFITVYAGFAFWTFTNRLLIENPVVGVIFSILFGFALLGATVLALRELRALGRMRRLDRLRKWSDSDWTLREREEALKLKAKIVALYRGREDLAWHVAELEARLDDAVDAEAVVYVTEAKLFAQLDKEAVQAVHASARQVALVTAFVPLALADVVTALIANLRMIREIATIYGGRSGGFGSWRLVRAVAAHLVATGAVALGDDLIQSLVGGGVLSKISRRFGEGLINGALTVRVGIAAMDVCRPMPFKAIERPKVRKEIQSAVGNIFTEPSN